MTLKTGFILAIAFLLIFISSELIFSQPEPIKLKVETEEPQIFAEPEVVWLWGEVISVDSAKNNILVKYLDYETDQEKEMVITADWQTTYSNISSLKELKPQDTVSVDYIITKGNNIAKNISVEKMEATEMLEEGPGIANETIPAAQE